MRYILLMIGSLFVANISYGTERYQLLQQDPRPTSTQNVLPLSSTTRREVLPRPTFPTRKECLIYTAYATCAIFLYSVVIVKSLVVTNRLKEHFW